MNRYDIYLFFHIACAIAWVGSAFLLHVQAFRALKASDIDGVLRVVRDTGGLANVLFIPASLGVLIFGLLMIFDGPWSFDVLFVDIGLAGVAVSFGLGVAVLKPRSEAFMAIYERDGMTEEALANARQMLIVGRIEFMVLLLVVADMVLKPTWNDPGLIAVMAAAFVGSAAVILGHARGAETGLRAA